MPKPTLTRKADSALTIDQGVDIHTITFKSAGFADTAAVDTFLAQYGIGNYTIESVSDGFVVKGLELEAFESVSDIPMGEAVFSVGKIKAPEAPTPEPTQKGALPLLLTRKSGESLAQKFCYYEACESRGRTLREVITDAMSDGFPIGFNELFYVFEKTLRNLVKDGDYSGITSLTAELGDYLTRLANFSQENLVSKATFVKGLLDQVVKEPISFTDVNTNTPTPAAPATPPQEPVAKQENGTSAPAAPVTPPVTETAVTPPADPLAQVLTALKAIPTLEQITALVDSKLKPVTESVEAVTKAANEQKERLDAVAPPARKSDPDGGFKPAAPATPPATPATPPAMSRAQKNALGIRD